MEKDIISYIAQADSQVAELTRRELERQQNGIELIASENYPSPAVRMAMASIFTAKYAEGYPGKRYYGGCEVVDELEEMARQRLLRLFHADGWHANVQPHSGSQANMAVFAAVLQPGDPVMGMSLEAGGHLTHANPQGLEGKLYNARQYGVDPATGLIDYDQVQRIALEHKPRLIVCGASAYPRVIDFARFRQIADSVGAYLMADIAHIAGPVAAGLHPSPIPYADFVTSTTHKTLRGPRGGIILCKPEFARAIDRAVFPVLQGGPLEHIIAAKAVCFHEAAQPAFVRYQQRVLDNCQALADGFRRRGFQMVTGGTDNHLLLLNTYGSLGLTGRQAEDRLFRCHITVNKNTIPGETLKPSEASGIRIGSAAVTTRGMGVEQMDEIAGLIARALSQEPDEALARQAVELAGRYPLFQY
ncbi:MAG: serine hydroxymethyltransferase [Clostridiales bacterium]|nr:serine hydroxymethyltransferase [Clostridiales bacterium]